MNPVEAAWRKFRSDYGDMLMDMLGYRASYLSSIGLDRLPNEVVLPVAVPWNVVAVTEAKERGEEIGEGGVKPSSSGNVLVGSLATWAAYREAKTFYRVDSLLADCLIKTPWPEHVPTAALRLPSRCPVLEIPWQGGIVHIAVHYDLMTTQEETGQLELRIMQLSGSYWLPISFLHLAGDTLQDCIKSAGFLAKLHAPNPESVDPLAFRTPLAGLVLTLLLYLAGEPDVVKVAHPGERPEKEAKMRRSDPDRWRDLHSPASYDVGTSFRAAIERWEIERQKEAGLPTGKSVRPHMRRAHAHLYWTGEKRSIPKVVFLMPISVKGGRIVEEPEGPIEQEVK